MPLQKIVIETIPTWIFNISFPNQEGQQLIRSHTDSADMVIQFMEVPPTEDEAKISMNEVKKRGYVPLFVHIYPTDNHITVYVRAPKLVCLKNKKK